MKLKDQERALQLLNDAQLQGLRQLRGPYLDLEVIPLSSLPLEACRLFAAADSFKFTSGMTCGALLCVLLKVFQLGCRA